MIALIVGICAFAFMRHNLIVRICVGLGAYYLVTILMPFIFKAEGFIKQGEGILKNFL
jgi:hypothetical protein